MRLAPLKVMQWVSLWERQKEMRTGLQRGLPMVLPSAMHSVTLWASTSERPWVTRMGLPRGSLLAMHLVPRLAMQWVQRLEQY